MQKAIQKRPLAEEPEWKEFMEAVRAANSDKEFKEAIRQFVKEATS